MFAAAPKQRGQSESSENKQNKTKTIVHLTDEDFDSEMDQESEKM